MKNESPSNLKSFLEISVLAIPVGAVVMLATMVDMGDNSSRIRHDHEVIASGQAAIANYDKAFDKLAAKPLITREDLATSYAQGGKRSLVLKNVTDAQDAIPGEKSSRHTSEIVRDGAIGVTALGIMSLGSLTIRSRRRKHHPSNGSPLQSESPTAITLPQ